MNILRESMTKVSYNSWTIRVWREIELGKTENRTEIRNRAVDATLCHKTEEEIAKYVLELDRVNAVEVLNFKGEGEVLYRDWP